MIRAIFANNILQIIRQIGVIDICILLKKLFQSTSIKVNYTYIFYDSISAYRLGTYFSP